MQDYTLQGSELEQLSVNKSWGREITVFDIFWIGQNELPDIQDIWWISVMSAQVQGHWSIIIFQDSPHQAVINSASYPRYVWTGPSLVIIYAMRPENVRIFLGNASSMK